MSDPGRRVGRSPAKYVIRTESWQRLEAAGIDVGPVCSAFRTCLQDWMTAGAGA